MKQQWLGIIGRNGSGKSTVCDYLVSKGYSVYSLSDVVRHYASAQGLHPSRDALTQLANQLKQQHGMDFFARSVLDLVSSSKSSGLVAFDSIRHPTEIDVLREHRVLFVGIHAPLADCYHRIKHRAKSTDFVTFKEFKRQDEYESNGSSPGQLIARCLDLCDYSIKNNGDIRELYNKVDKLLSLITNKAHAN
jgi:dephospho-CoA kinase